MKLIAPVAVVFLASSLCCCADLFEKLGVEIPAMGGGSMPESMSDFPEYAGAELISSGTVGDISTVTYNVDGAAPKEIVDFYKESLEGSGWTVDTHIDVEDTSSMQLTKEGLKGTVTATTSGDEIWLVLSVEG
jgi:hypothetical protein